MKRKPYRFLLYLILRAAMALVARLPRSFALYAARTGARMAFTILPAYRRRTEEHLRGVFGNERSDSEISGMAKQVFVHLAQTGADWVIASRLSPEERTAWCRTDAGELDRFDSLMREGRGVIALAAHLGNWELIAAFFADRGYTGAVVGRRIYYEPYNRIIVGMRNAWKVRTIYRDTPPKDILRLLRKGQIVGMLADQDVDSVDGIFVPFLGRPAFTPTAPVRLALASGAPIVPVFLVREGNAYRLIIHEPIRVSELPGRSREEAVTFFTERWTSSVENMIRTYPEQWVWMHRRWKTHPAESRASESAPLWREARAT